MTSTRSTTPAPPPNGVSSTWPPLSGLWSRGFSARISEPRSSAFATWRWERNQSNHSGNRVKTSIRTARSVFDDLNHDATLVASRRSGLGDGAERVGDAALAADHAAEVIVGD